MSLASAQGAKWLLQALCPYPLGITQGRGVSPPVLPASSCSFTLFSLPSQGPAGVRGAPGTRGMKGRRVSASRGFFTPLLFQPLEEESGGVVWGCEDEQWLWQHLLSCVSAV